MDKIVLSPDGTTAYTDGGAITSIVVPNMTILQQVTPGQGTLDLAISGNGMVLGTRASAYNTSLNYDTIAFYNASDLSFIGQVDFPPDSTFGHLVLDGEGNYAYIDANQISIQSLSVVQTSVQAQDAAISVNGGHLYSLVNPGNNIAHLLNPIRIRCRPSR